MLKEMFYNNLGFLNNYLHDLKVVINKIKEQYFFDYDNYTIIYMNKKGVEVLFYRSGYDGQEKCRVIFPLNIVTPEGRELFFKERTDIIENAEIIRKRIKLLKDKEKLEKEIEVVENKLKNLDKE